MQYLLIPQRRWSMSPFSYMNCSRFIRERTWIMTNQRTGGMLAMGILNIIFGSLGSLYCLLVIVGGGLLAIGGTAMQTEAAGTDAQGLGSAAATGGGLIMVIGLVLLACWGMLAIGGIGAIMVANWGRLMCMTGGGTIALMSIGSNLFNGLSLGAMLAMGYGLLNVTLFMKEDWKDAFTGNGMQPAATPGETTAPMPGLPNMPAAGNDEFNEAA